MRNNITYKLTFLLITLDFSMVSVFGQSDRDIYKPNKVRKLPTDFREAYSGDEYNYIDHVSFIDKLKAWFIDLIARTFSFGSEKAFNTFEYFKHILLFLIVGATIYYLVKLIVNKEGRWLFGKNYTDSNEVILDEVQNIAEADFKKMIEEAENNSNFRLAIKYHYLYLLKKMDVAQTIKYDSQKTSHDYLIELEGTSFYSNFSKSAYYYTYIWYGEFEIDDSGYKKAAHSFVTLQNQFNND